MFSDDTSLQEHEKIERLRDRMLQCPICMDEYKDPRILPCHHTVCLNCLLDYVHASSSSGRLFRCPQCRADVCVPRGGVKDFPPNFYINCIQDEIGSRPYFGICDVCQRDWLMSQYRCIDCDLDICKFCVHDHRLFKHMTGRQSNVIKIETGNIGLTLTSEKVCSTHKEESLQMYCLTCDIAICVACVCEEHRKHNTMTLAKKLQLARKHLQFDLDQLQLDIKEVKSSLTELHQVEKNGDKSADDTILLIQDHAQDLIHRIHKQADSKIDEVKADRGKYLKDMHDYEKDLAGYLDQLQRASVFLGDLQEEDMCLELLASFQKYRGVLESAEKSITNRVITRKNFTFKPGNVVDKRGHMWVGKSKLENSDVSTVLMQRAKERRGLIGHIRENVTVFGILAILVTICLSIGLGQFISALMSEEVTTEIAVCAGLYVYVCLAGVFAYRKSNTSATQSKISTQKKLN